MWLLKALQSIRPWAKAIGTMQTSARMHFIPELRIDRRSSIFVGLLLGRAFNRRERRENSQRTQRNPERPAPRIETSQRSSACESVYSYRRACTGSSRAAREAG